ncbi:MAG: LytTR family DNA-binding domain-containing protein [Tunicatimonas sp.]
MNCIIIEDQPPAQRILQKYLDDLGSWQLRGTFSDALAAMELLKTESIDLIFLDIHLPKLSGIDFLKTIPQPTAVILTTAFPDYALEGYELDVVDYLLKPFSFQRFVKAVSKVTVRASPLPPTASPPPVTHPEIFIKVGYEHVRLATDDILYIKSDADYTEVVLPAKKHLSSEPLRNWLQILPNEQFVRVHKSYIVNTARIAKVIGNRIHINNKVVVPIGRAYKEDFAKKFLR